MISTVAALICQEDMVIASMTLLSVFVAAACAWRSISAYQHQYAEWVKSCELLRQAEEAQPSQRLSHLRDSERLAREVTDVSGEIQSLRDERLATRRVMKDCAARTLALEEANRTLCDAVNDIGVEAEDLVQLLTNQRDTAAAEATELFDAVDVVIRDNQARTLQLADFKWQCEREIALVTTRAENAVTRAIACLDANEDGSEDSEVPRGAPVTEAALCEAVQLHSRYQHLQLASEAVCAEVKRVWEGEVTQLEARVRRNAKILAGLQEEACDRENRDHLVDCCVKLEDEALLTEAAAEEVEEEVWTRSVERNNHSRLDHAQIQRSVSEDVVSQQLDMSGASSSNSF